jgi:hypothetical protein
VSTLFCTGGDPHSGEVLGLISSWRRGPPELDARAQHIAATGSDEEDAHRPSEPHGGFQNRDRLLPRNRRKRVKKFIEAVSSLKIIEEVSQRHTCANEYGSPAKDLWIAMHDRGCVTHEIAPFPEMPPSPFRLIIYLKPGTHPTRLKHWSKTRDRDSWFVLVGGLGGRMGQKDKGIVDRVRGSCLWEMGKGRERVRTKP